MDPKAIYNAMGVTAKIAGRQFLEKPERDSEEKSNAKDFATVSDIKAQQVIATGLKSLFPKTAAGVVYDPYKNELFGAIKGQGATRNSKPIHVSKQKSLSGASVATSNSYDDAAMARNLRRHLAIYEQSGIMPWTNCPGSGVLIMAYVACGRFDAYHHNGLKPWDNAAAFLIIREAGGEVQTLDGKEAAFTSQTVLTGNPSIVHELRRVFNGLDAKLLV